MTVAICCPYRPDGDRRDLLWRWCKARWEWLLPDSVIVTADTADEAFNRGKAINQAVDVAVSLYHADQLIIADTDTFVQPTQLQGAIALLARRRWCAPFTTYYNLDLPTSDAVLQGPVDIDWPRDFGWEHQIPPVPTGVVLTTKDAFIGFDERFVGWGWEDNAWAADMRRAHGQVKLITGAAFHLWHPVNQAQTWEQPFAEHNQRLAEEHQVRDFTYEALKDREVRWS